MYVFVCSTAILSVESVVSILGGILQDDSPVAVRQACSALKVLYKLILDGNFLV